MKQIKAFAVVMSIILAMFVPTISAAAAPANQISPLCLALRAHSFASTVDSGSRVIKEEYLPEGAGDELIQGGWERVGNDRSGYYYRSSHGSDPCGPTGTGAGEGSSTVGGNPALPFAAMILLALLIAGFGAKFGQFRRKQNAAA